MQKHPAQSYIEADVQPPRIGWHRNTKPHPFKLYHNSEQIRCTYEAFETQEEQTESECERAQIGQMLADIYGLTCQSHIIKEESPFFQVPFARRNQNASAFHQTLLRPIPSGGVLFPCELYVLVGPGQAFPVGLYHYDAAHHALDILRQGDYAPLLQAFLAHPDDIPSGYAFLLSCFFWKDGFKYGAFSYRLQGLDIGTVIGQSLIVSDHYNREATIHYQFLDKAIDELLGLDPLHESIYAVMTLAPTPHAAANDSTVPAAQEPIQDEVLPEAEQLESVAYWPLVEEVHRASLIESRSAFRPLHSLPPIKRAGRVAGRALPLADAAPDLWPARYQRRSAAGFRPASLSEQQLAQLLAVSLPGTRNDLDRRSDFLLHTLLYCVVNRVQHVPSGIYVYSPEEQRLALVEAKEVQSRFQELLGWANFNMFQMSVCLVPVANYQDGFQVYGDRWYRMQNMEAGIIAQRLYLAAATLKLGCRANLGFPIAEMDKFLCLPENYTSLLQVLVAPEQAPPGHYAQSLLL
jgi:SagB-type dehydrogenase family enzyme